MAEAKGTRQGTLAVVGLHGGEWFGHRAGGRLSVATVITGDPRHVDAVPADLTGERVPWDGPLSGLLDSLSGWVDSGEQVVVLASGDPGFFGLARLVCARFPAGAVELFPAPSSVALAFAAAGVHWDDAAVVSAHGRPLEHALDVALRHPKVAVLTSPQQPPQAIGAALQDRGCAPRRVVVASSIGEAGERVWHGDLAGLAAGRFDGLSVVLLIAPDTPEDGGPGIAWGLPESRFEHRGGMITKSEVRAVALGKLSLPTAGVVWDVGAGSGSVSAECSRLAPGLSVFAVERDPGDAARARRNLEGTAACVVEGEAPAALDALPDPDRAFVGGGGLQVLKAVVRRLRPDGRVVATFASLDRAVAAADLLGNLVQISVARGIPVGPGQEDLEPIATSLRLQAENPVFVCWSEP